MLVFLIVFDVCNGIEYYIFLRCVYIRGIFFLFNIKFNIRKYFLEKIKKKKNNLFFWLWIYGILFISLKLKNRFYVNCILSFWYRCFGVNNL